jgi:hypothetical protein
MACHFREVVRHVTMEQFVILPLADVDVACVGIWKMSLYLIDGLQFSCLSVVADEYASPAMFHWVTASDIQI